MLSGKWWVCTLLLTPALAVDYGSCDDYDDYEVVWYCTVLYSSVVLYYSWHHTSAYTHLHVCGFELAIAHRTVFGQHH